MPFHYRPLVPERVRWMGRERRARRAQANIQRSLRALWRARKWGGGNRTPTTRWVKATGSTVELHPKRVPRLFSVSMCAAAAAHWVLMLR